MGRRQAEVEEQPVLFEVDTEEGKKIAAAARAYKRAVAARMEESAEELKLKRKLADLIKQHVDVKPDSNGKFSFRANGVVITITMTEERFKVVED